MIRKLQETDIDRVAAIWLDTNLKAHDFIAESYWLGNFDEVKGLLAQAELYVYEDEIQGIQGFIGLEDTYIAGIFVSEKVQSRGIGKQLLDFIKERKEELSLSVYQKNAGAIRFYEREGVAVRHTGLDEQTGEKEYQMVWQKEKEVFLQKEG